MQELDLTPFGFEGKTFRYHGRIVSERKDGQRLLFLFGEAHTDQPAIRLAILNACELWRLEILGCVGVEEYPFYFLGWDDAAIRARSADVFAQCTDDEGIIRKHMDAHRPHLPFGKTIKMIRPDIPVRSVEDFQLHKLMQSLEFHAGQLASNVAHDAPSQIRNHAQELIKQAYEQCKANRDRDDAFLGNLLPWWQELAPAKAAILNAGKSHQERILHKLSTDIAYIRIDTTGA